MLAAGLAAWVAMSPGFAQPSRPRDQMHDVTTAFNRALLTASGGGLHVPLGDQAVLTVPAEELFLPRSGADALLQAAGRPVPNDYAGLMVNEAAIDWYGALQVVAHGHVDAGEVESWTPDDLIASIRDSVAHGNVQRVAGGEPPLEVRRWVQRPAYDTARHHLSWCLLILPEDSRRDAGGVVVYNAVTFGRTGYVRLELTTTIDQLPRQTDIPATILDHIDYRPGQGFADYQSAADARDPAGLAGVFGVDHVRKADLKTRLRAFGEPLILPGGITLVVAMVGGLTLLVYRWRLHRPVRR